MSVLSLLMLQNRESHPVANRKNGRGAPLTARHTGGLIKATRAGHRRRGIHRMLSVDRNFWLFSVTGQIAGVRYGLSQIPEPSLRVLAFRRDH
jgi:hypothetical protein